MIEPIPLAPMQQSGLEVLAGASPAAFNLVADRAGSVRRRPGIKAHAGVPSGVVDAAGLDVLHVASGGGFYAVGGQSGGRTIYKIGTTATAFSGADAELAGTAARVTVAETEAMLVMSAGTQTQKVVFATEDSSRLGGSPPHATHVIAHGGRVLSNNLIEGNDRVDYSGVATGSSITGHQQWGGAGTSSFFNAKGRPDPVRAVHENTNEVFLFGSTSMQIFSPDATDVYVPSATREYGCIAPYSVVKDDDSFAWLDDRRRFIKSDGREYDDKFGADIQQTIDDMATVSDCFGYRTHMGPVDALVWTLPTDTRTFVHQDGFGWSQWSGWDDTTNNWKRFMVNCAHQRPDTGVNVCGTTAGKIGEFHATTYTDLGDRIVARVDTGYLNRKTDKRKFCRAVYLSLKRGEVTGTTAPQASVSWRDDGGEWRDSVPVSLGVSGDREIVYPLRSLGVYRRRQWRFEFSGPEELVLVSASEDFEVLAD